MAAQPDNCFRWFTLIKDFVEQPAGNQPVREFVRECTPSSFIPGSEQEFRQVISSKLQFFTHQLVKMSNRPKEIEEDSQFQPELTNAGAKLVVVDFYATW